MHRAWQDERRAPLMLSALSIVLGLTAGLLMLLVQLTGQWWVRVLVGGFSPEGQRIALELIQVMALWMPAAVVVECLAAGEIAIGKSRIGALRSAVLNSFVIMGLLFYALSNNLMGLAWMFALSFNALAAWGCWLLAREGALSIKGLRISVLLAAGREFVRRLRPFIFLPVFQQGNTWVERLVASGFAVGTLSSLEYARTLTDTMVLLISQPIGMAVLHGGSTTANRSISAAVPVLLSITLPACVYLAVFAPDVVRLVLARGAFDETAVALTSGAMRGMAIGMWAGAVGMVLLRHLNNDGRNRIAAAILAISFTTGMMVNLASSNWAGTGDVRNAFLLGSAELGAMRRSAHCRHAGAGLLLVRDAPDRPCGIAGGGNGRTVLAGHDLLLIAADAGGVGRYHLHRDHAPYRAAADASAGDGPENPLRPCSLTRLRRLNICSSCTQALHRKQAPD